MRIIRIFLSVILLLNVFVVTAQDKYSLKDFYSLNGSLDSKVEEVFRALNDTQRVVQMIVSYGGENGKSYDEVKSLVEKNLIGGIIFLKGYKETHTKHINEFNSISKANSTLPLMFSSDAEPSLISGRIKGIPTVGNTINIKTEKKCDSVAKYISKHMLDMGMHQNYAPVVDMSPDNAAIKSRSFGRDSADIVRLAKQFIKTSQENQIVATAKHFPGHGLVQGDTHHQSVYIDGELKEIGIYEPLIADGVISIMVAHIVVKNNEKYNTNGLPSSCSPVIVNGLLKEEMGFKGIVTTDAMNAMKAVTIIEDAPLKASKAGCDIILMPIDELKTRNLILNEMLIDEAYKNQVYESVKKLIRLKICLGIIK